VPKGVVLCPLHLYARKHCSYRCAPARAEFAKAALALNTYWWHRRNGMKAMTVGEYRIRYGWPPRV